MNVTAGTVMLFEPSVSAVAGPKYQFPFAVVLATLKSAPPDGKFVTFIVKVWAPWLETPAATDVASRI